MTYIVDEPLAELVLGKIWDRYVSGEYPYNQNKIALLLPQNHLPPSLPIGGSEEAYYWVVLCLWMRTTQTDTAAKQLARLYEYLAKRRCLNPFNPFEAARLKPQRIIGLLKEVGLGLDVSAPRDWIENAKRLVQGWDGNVLKIFDGVEHYEEIWPLLINDKVNETGFVGFQHKMASMLLYFLSERSLIPSFPFPPPIDFHLMRVAAETGIIRREDGSSRIAYTEPEFDLLGELLRNLYLGYAERHGIPSNRFNDALWLLSKRLCRHNPGNRSHVEKVDNDGGTGRKRRIDPYIPNYWDRVSDRAKYQRSCGSCPIEVECRHNVPAADRYIAGELRLRSLRQRPPEHLLDNSLFSHHIGRV